MSNTRKHKTKTSWRAILLAVFVVYVILLFLALLGKWLPFVNSLSELKFARLAISDQEPLNTVFLASIKRDLASLQQAEFRGSAALNLFGNVLVFIPFGLLLPLILKKPLIYLRTLLSGFLCILSIELIQLLFSIGVWDIDDIFLNLLGLLCGAIISLPLRKIFKFS